MKRRVLLQCAAGSAMTALTPAMALKSSPFPGYSAATAPDRASAQILSRWLPSLDHGPFKHVSSLEAMARNFAQIIEQNLARRDSDQASRLFSVLNDSEVSALAQLYTMHTVHAGRPALLLDVLAHRLRADELARVSYHFGFASVYDALARVAPGKASAFGALADTTRSLPMPMSQLAMPQPTSGGGSAFRFLDMTITEIYLDFRTAPIGALSRPAAMFATATVAGGNWIGAFAFGQAIGTQLSSLMAVYTPDLYDVIGAGISWYVNALQAAPTPGAAGDAQALGAAMFQLQSPIADQYRLTGGDYGETSAWHALSVPGTGTCGFRPLGCQMER